MLGQIRGDAGGGKGDELVVGELGKIAGGDGRGEAEGDGAHAREAGAAGEGGERAVDRRGHDRRAAAAGQCTESRSQRGELAVGGARAFGEDEQGDEVLNLRKRKRSNNQ